MVRMQLEAEVATQDVVAQQACSASLFQGGFEAFVHLEDFAVDVVVAHRDAHGVSRNGHAFDHGVRVEAQDFTVLACTRFTFVRITDQVLLTRERTGHEAPLEPGWEACAATTAQCGRFDFCNDFILGHARTTVLTQDLAQSSVTTTCFVVFQAPVGAVNACVNLWIDVTTVENGFRAGRLELGKVKHLVFTSLGLSLEHINQLIQLVIAHVADHVAVVDQHHGSISACTQALALLHGEQAVWSCTAGFHAEFVAQVLQRLLTVTQLARQVGANVQFELACWLLVVHVVEGDHFMHSNGWHADVVSHFLLALRRHPATFLLDDGQAGHDSRLTLVSRVLGQFAVEARFGLFAQHRSIT